MDRHTPEQRSYNMSQIKSVNTKPEIFVFKVLDNMGIKYQKHFNIYGKPDVAFQDKKIAVFINGEFWHGRRFNKERETYKEFWVTKIKHNMIRDRKNYNLLKNEGWTVVNIWDKDIKKHPKREMNKIMRLLNKPSVRKSDLEV